MPINDPRYTAPVTFSKKSGTVHDARTGQFPTLREVPGETPVLSFIEPSPTAARRRAVPYEKYNHRHEGSVRMDALRNPELLGDELEQIVFRELSRKDRLHFDEVKMIASEHPNSSRTLLDFISSGGAAGLGIRENVLRHPNTSNETIQRLRVDGFAAYQNAIDSISDATDADELNAAYWKLERSTGHLAGVAAVLASRNVDNAVMHWSREATHYQALNQQAKRQQA
ncbi:hypothetical protein [Leifsonia sp. Leaf264]|uniref:hypothetical protein n=1 Tax=Leifsonia sp. Leaf264 TaxID=1736314 RepID=UPI0006F4F59C|nr:hypothetical protein [Leifsonia sp. Leaf264]KQO98825.1 hypothetical protein ASF30_12240 [Leifsonia sp. Leaf264]